MKRINIRTSISLIMCMVLISLTLSQGFVFATPISEKKARVSEIKEQIDSLDTQIEIADEEYLQAQNRLSGIKDKVYLTKASLGKAKVKLSKNKKLLNNRAKGLYKNGSLSFLDIIFSTKSFNEFLVGLDFIIRVGNRDAVIIRKVKKAEAELKTAQKQLNTAKASQEKVVNTLYDKKKSIENSLAEKQDLMSGIEADIEKLQQQERQAAVQILKSNNAPVSDSGGAPPNAPKSGVVGVAYAQLGKPYQYGAAGPNAFDCSGLTMYCYAQVGVSLPHSSGAQYGCGAHVSQSNLMPGDLVFFGSPIHHVGLYVGNGAMIHAPHSGAVVEVAPAFRGDYVGATRP